MVDPMIVMCFSELGVPQLYVVLSEEARAITVSPFCNRGSLFCHRLGATVCGNGETAAYLAAVFGLEAHILGGSLDSKYKTILLGATAVARIALSIP